jgi:hypothetical protein
MPATAFAAALLHSYMKAKAHLWPGLSLYPIVALRRAAT